MKDEVEKKIDDQLLAQQAPVVLSRWERAFFFVKTNRKAIGTALTVIAGFVRWRLAFEGNEQVAETLRMVADMFITGSVATMASGTFKSDSYHRDKMVEVVRSRSQEMPTFDPEEYERRRRIAQRRGSPYDANAKAPR
jgi:hypothetical protein